MIAQQKGGTNMKWTAEQQRIIDLKGCNILVSAAAGSGKTAVMVERIVQLVKQGENIDNFLVVTFTKAAANGMRRKIQKALLGAVQNKEGDTKHLRKQLSLLNKALITTIDSFCSDVVKKNFFLADLDPNFRVGDKNEVDILLTEAIDEALEQTYENIDENEDFKIFVESFSGIRDDEQLSEIIQKTYKFILSFPDPFVWLEESTEKLNMSSDDVKNSNWFKELTKHIKMMLGGAIAYIDTALEICNEPDGPHIYKDEFYADRQSINELIEFIDEDFSDFIIKLSVFEFKEYKIKYSAKEHTKINIYKKLEVAGGKDPNSGKTIKGLREKSKVIIDDIKELFIYGYDFEHYADDIKKMLSPFVALKEVIIQVDKKYKQLKSSKSIVDYNDLEHFALNILRSKSEESSNGYVPSPAAINYKNKFSYIFIDEYQDSNSLQEAIINQIKRENNVFMVGDVKQSIYRFRLADPSIFNSKYDIYHLDRPDLSSEIKDRIIELNKNFRSRDEILSATNFVFHTIMSKELGEIDYTSNVFLNTGAEFETKTKVELDLIDKNSDVEESNKNNSDDDDISNSSEAAEEIDSMQTAELEALHVVQKIRELLKTEVCEAGKSEDGKAKTRETQYKDIVILHRSPTSWAGIFEERFNKEDIPFYYDGGKGYYETIEIQVLVNTLKLIDNFRQDIPLLSVMRSPIGNFTTEEILEVKLKFSQFKHYVSAFNSYVKVAEEIEKDEKNKDENNKDKYKDYSIDLAYKLKKFKDTITDYRYKSNYSHLSDLIWHILVSSNYYSFVGSLPNGKSRQANLRMLADKADEYEKTSMRGLFKFLRYIEKMNKNSDNTGSAKILGENDNVVRLMSIHKSKGLEFPVVILCAMNKQFNQQDMKQNILLHKDFGIGPKCINIDERTKKNTLLYDAIKNTIKKENLSEEMRLLYVAMTRAIDKLVMVGTVNKLEKASKDWKRKQSKYFVFKAKSYMDWIGSCLFEGVNYENFINILEQGEYKDWKINKITRESLGANANEEIENKNERINALNDFTLQQNTEHYDEINRRLSYKYPYESSVKVPTKLSVTEMKKLKQEDFSRLRFNIPQLNDVLEYDNKSESFKLEQNVSGAEIGTILHFVMEHMDLKEDLSIHGVTKQINHIKNKDLLTEKETQIIINTYAEKIAGFYSSSLGNRIKNATSVHREVPFVLRKKTDEVLDKLSKDDLILIQGIIDCYFIENGEAVLVDYKTDTVAETKNTAKQIEKLKELYKDQIALYKEALEKITGVKVKESYLYMFSIGEEVKV